MKNPSQFIATICIAAFVSYAATHYTRPAPAENKAPVTIADTLPEKIRCGYVNYPPYFLKDPTTGALSGIFYDMTQKISEEIGIPVEWSVESSFGGAVTDLQFRKFDVFCSGIWADPKRARIAAFSIPAAYSAALMYIRADDTRFDGKSVAELQQDPALKIAVSDGEFSDIIRKSMFPQSQVLSEPQTAPLSQLADDIYNKKADITILERSNANDYMKANPGKIKELSATVLHLGESSWAFNQDDRNLRDLFDAAIRKLNGNGYTDMVLRKYETTPGDFYRAAKPYETANP